MLDYSIHVMLLPVYLGIWAKTGPNIERNVLAPFRKQNSFNTSRIDGKCDIDVVHAMHNTLQTLELASFSVMYFHMKTLPYPVSPNIIQWFMYEAIVKDVIQGPECVKHGIIPIRVKSHIVPQIIKGVPFPEWGKYHFSQF